MEQMTADILIRWHTKILAMELAYQRMANCNTNSGMYCLYRDEYKKARAECDEIDNYISHCGFTGYEEYVIRLRFQEAMPARKIAGKLKLDCGIEKPISAIQNILNSAIAKMGLTKTGKISTSAKGKKKDEVHEEMVTENDETEIEEVKEPQDTEELVEQVDTPRDIYGNPIDDTEYIECDELDEETRQRIIDDIL